jgi:hypothetical protein
MKNVRATLVLAALVVVPALAVAQQVPKHEFGVDLAAVYSIPSCSGCSGHVFTLGTPVDVRVGFLARGPLSFEVRFSGALSSASGGGSSFTAISLGPGLNLLYRLSGKSERENVYFTAGGQLEYSKLTGSDASTDFTLDAGLGMRRPWGSAASRAEAFGAYTFKNTKSGTPAMIHIGLRLGVSFFH